MTNDETCFFSLIRFSCCSDIALPVVADHPVSSFISNVRSPSRESELRRFTRTRKQTMPEDKTDDTLGRAFPPSSGDFQ
jgi:hypothetical protein